VSRRSGVLELAVLGLLADTPMHGYELRKRLNAVLGSFRAFSYGSLYPCLKSLVVRGWIAEDVAVPSPGRTAGRAPARSAARASNRRSKIVYKLTAEGKEQLQEMLAEAGPSAWEDDNFGVHFALFARTDAETRMRILEGRRNRLEERLEGVRTALGRTRERLDSYTLELQRHGLESVEREVRWLNELIHAERHAEQPGTPNTPDATDPSVHPVK